MQCGGTICYTQEVRRYFMAKVTTYPGRLGLADTLRDRMELIRVAIGGSISQQISQEELGRIVQERTGAAFDKYKVSRIERGVQPLSRDDAIAIASVDPLRRGAAWLMFGNEGDDSGGEGVPV